MTILTKRRFIIPAFVITTTAVVFAGKPTTVPVAADLPTLMRDVQMLNSQLNVALPQGTLSDAVKRNAAAPTATSILKRMESDFDQIVAAKPEAAPRLATARRQVASMLAALGDSAAIQSMQTLATNPDPKLSAQGHGDQILTRWYEAGKDAAGQSAIVDDLEKLDTAHLTDSNLTVLTMQMSNSAATPALHARLQTLAVETMKSPASAAIKRQLDAGAAKQAEHESVLTKLVDRPMTIAGTRPDGKPFTTADWKGKVILVDFWATWCGPCKAELPRTKQIYEQYHPKGLELLGVSNDFQVDALKKFVVDQQMPWPELVDAEAAADQQWNPITLTFGITGIPTMFLIDKKGIVRSVTARQDMETMIPKLLAEPS